MNAGPNRSALRSLEVFEAFRAARRPLSLSELARLTETPVSTCHGVMRALQQRGYLYAVAGRDVYPTRRLWDLADDLRACDPVVARLEPGLSALRDETDETVLLGTRQGDQALYLLVIEGRQSIRYTSRAGELKPLHSSAIGKVILAGLAPAELDAWLDARSLERVTPRTRTTARGLRADFLAGARRGWQSTCGENVADVMAIAAPLRLGGSVFGVAVAGPMHRMEPAGSRIAQRLLRCLRSLEEGDVR